MYLRGWAGGCRLIFVQFLPLFIRAQNLESCLMNVSLNSSYEGKIKVAPRFPYRRVIVAREALRRLENAQGKLEPDVRLVLTRAFEPGNLVVRMIHAIGRKIGARLFGLFFPRRILECQEIFSSNGHDRDGTHLDVSVEYRGRVKKLLPLGVFSSACQLELVRRRESSLLHSVYQALTTSGFRIHNNPTEALQIHCDMINLT